MTQLRRPVALPIPRESSPQSLFDLSPTPMWVHDDETLCFLAVNESALRHFDYGRERFLAMTLHELRPVPAASESAWAVIEGEPGRDRLRRSDGVVVEVELAGRRIEHAGRPAWLVTATDIGERVRLEQALIESRHGEERYRQLFDVASDWFWETDARNRLVYLSPNIEGVLGLPVSSYIGKRVSDTEGIVIETEVGRATLAAIKARRSYRDFTYCRKVPDGRIVWVNSSGVPFYGEDGDFRGYRGIARDITAQVEAEGKLRESEQRFRRLFEIGSDYYWEQDAQHNLTFAAPELLHDAIYGVPLAQLIGKRVTETLAVSFEPEAGRRALVAYKGRHAYRDLVFSVKHDSGAVRWVSLTGAPRFGEDGEFLGYHGTGVEITLRREAEAATQLAQRRLHDAVAHVTQPFVVYDAEDRAAAFNQAFADLFRTPTRNTPVHSGVSLRELVDWQVETVFFADGPDEPVVDLEALLAHHQTEDEQTYHLSDGRWMLVRYRRLPGGGRVGLWTDVTAIKRAELERRNLEQQLHHSQRLEALGTLAGGVAHELNNALVPVIALTKLVARKLPEGSRERRNLDTVVGAAQRSRDLVEQILSFSRKDGGQRRENVDLGEVLREALCLMRATVPTSIRIDEAILPTPALDADPGQLQQVIVNLITNAAHAVGEAMGTIGVRLAPMSDSVHLCLSVSDTGCGMDEATMARIFEPFFTTREVGKGTGLGLAVVHGIIKSHGGRIEVESVIGKGTRFDVILPMPAAAEARDQIRGDAGDQAASPAASGTGPF
jgi:PAS domain S-box-containing protein